MIKPRMTTLGAFVGVLVLWMAYSRLVLFFWAYYPQVNPLMEWALTTLIPDHRVLFYALLYTHDLLINLLLVLPLAYLLRRFVRRSLWGPVTASVIIVFLWDYRGVFANGEVGFEFFSGYSALIGAAMHLSLLPIPYYLAGKLPVGRSERDDAASAEQ